MIGVVGQSEGVHRTYAICKNPEENTCARLRGLPYTRAYIQTLFFSSNKYIYDVHSVHARDLQLKKRYLGVHTGPEKAVCAGCAPQNGVHFASLGAARRSRLIATSRSYSGLTLFRLSKLVLGLSWAQQLAFLRGTRNEQFNRYRKGHWQTNPTRQIGASRLVTRVFMWQ